MEISDEKEMYYFGDRLKKEKFVEFKSLSSGEGIEDIIHISQEYVNAFLNTAGFYLFLLPSSLFFFLGGKLYFGVEKDGEIRGITLSRKDRDDVR
jgi:hypothetical protein